MQEVTRQWVVDSEYLNSGKTRRPAWWGLIGVLLTYLVVLIDPLQNPDVVGALLREDGVFESLTVFCFVIAAMIFGFAWWRQRNIFFLLLSIVFIVGAGEEFSWAQRIFDYQTPESILEHNTQKEFNFHNLEWLGKRDNSGQWQGSVGQLFNLFWMFYYVLIPIAAYTSTNFRNLIERIDLPIVNPWIGVLFPINYLAAKLMQLILPIEQLNAAEHYTEATEFVFSFLIAIAAFDLVLRGTHLPRNK